MSDYDLIKEIIEGEFPCEGGYDHKREISTQFFDTMDEGNLDDILLARDDIGRVYTFKRYFKWIPVQDKHLDPYRKNVKTASILREIAKAAQAQKNLKEAIKYYNLAAAYAPFSPVPSDGSSGGPHLDEDLSQMLIEIMAERADVLLQVRGGEEGLRDANFLLGLLSQAQNYDSPSPFLKGMLERVKETHAKCLKFLEEKASFMIELAQDSLEEMEKRRKYKNLLLFRVKNPNPLLPCAESFVEIKVDKAKGRKLVLTRDIPAGTTVIVEEPYVKVLKEGLKFEMQHCHYCLLKIRGGGGIPCPGCVFEIYCSETCQKDAYNKYHRYECPCLCYLHWTSTPRYIHMALRIVCTLGPQELYRLFTTKDPLYFKPNGAHNKVLGSCPETGVYDSKSYLPIYHLISHPDPSNREVEYITNVIQALIFTNTLETLSVFYDQPKYLETHPRDYFKSFVASMILHHMENIPPNSISVDELVGLEGISLLVKEPTVLQERIRALQRPQYASATYALSSLINHSCEPSVTRLHGLTHAKMALVTLKSLKAGEELLTSYTKIFLSDTVEERKDYLQKTYSFTCDCIACTQKWPILAKISEGEPRFWCAGCIKKLSGDERATGFARYILDKKGLCRSCKKGASLDVLRDGLDQRIESFFDAYELILKNRPLEAVRLLGPCAQFFQDNICPPYNKIYMSQDLLKTALDLIIHYSVSRT